MGKTITTYLIDGDPKGTQYAFISNKICQMFVIPRSNLAYLNEQESDIYFGADLARKFREDKTLITHVTFFREPADGFLGYGKIYGCSCLLHQLVQSPLVTVLNEILPSELTDIAISQTAIASEQKSLFDMFMGIFRFFNFFQFIYCQEFPFAFWYLYLVLDGKLVYGIF